MGRLAANSAAAEGVAGRYATALFGLASERGALDKVESDLGALSRALQEAPELRRVLRSPIVSRDEHERALETVEPARQPAPHRPHAAPLEPEPRAARTTAFRPIDVQAVIDRALKAAGLKS